MKLSVALVAAALAAASATTATAANESKSGSAITAFTPIPGKAKQTAQLSRRQYVQCYRRAYQACVKRVGGGHRKYSYCRVRARGLCRMMLPGRRG